MTEKMNNQNQNPENEGLEVGRTQVEEPRRTHGKGFNAWWQERTLGEKILTGIGFAILGIGFVALIGLAVMILWNWLMPDIFGLKRLNYWQAWGLLVLCWILFKSFGTNTNTTTSRSDRKRKQQLRRYMQESENPAGED